MIDLYFSMHSVIMTWKHCSWKGNLYIVPLFFPTYPVILGSRDSWDRSGTWERALESSTSSSWILESQIRNNNILYYWNLLMFLYVYCVGYNIPVKSLDTLGWIHVNLCQSSRLCLNTKKNSAPMLLQEWPNLFWLRTAIKTLVTA